MDAHQLLSDFQARGIRLTPEGGKLAVEPAERLSEADRVAIRQAKRELLRILAPEPSHVIEATFRSAADEAARQPSAIVDHQFPPCPECGSRRYWISRGKVICGSKACYSAVRFILTSIAIN